MTGALQARSLSGVNRLCRERPKNLLVRARGGAS